MITYLSLLIIPLHTLTATAGVSGQVTDLNGGILPGVTVTVTAANTRVRRVAVSDHAGTYSVTGLSPGSYELSFELAGFDIRQAAIAVEKDVVRKLDMVLPLGAVTEDTLVCICDPVIDPWQVTRNGQPPPTRLVEQRLRVLDAFGQPLPYAHVEVFGLGLSLTTGADGVVCWWGREGYFPTIKVSSPPFRSLNFDMCCMGGNGEVKMRSEVSK